MKIILWLASKLLLGNLRRALFPYIGATAGIAALIIAFSIGAGGEKLISNNLMAISDNRMMLGGDEFSQRDMRILENYPFIEYSIFPEARIEKNGSIFIAYSQRALEKLKLPNLRDREIIIDKNQFPDKKKGDMLELVIDNRKYRFLISDTYIEENPFELMKQGNRIIVSQDYFERLFNIYRYKEIVISVDKDEDAEEMIPILLEKFNNDRNGYKSIRILETPEVYKRIIKIQKMVKMTLYTLAALSLILSGVGIMSLISSGIRARTGHIGILRSIGMPKEDVVKVFLTEGIIISIVGTFTGIIVGIVGSVIGGKLIMIPPVFLVRKIILAIIFALLVGVGMGIFPAKKAGNMSIIDALKED